jgi:hypothetical protein
LWLFKPATAYRVRPGSDEGTPVPMDEAPAEEFGFLGLRLPDGEPVTLHKVAGALTGLLMIVDGAEAAPTADARAAAEKWEAAGVQVLVRWKAVEADLAAVNAVLEKAKLQPLGK